ncbi:isoaspartyl peptidase/L-asparaginase [Sphingomonas sp. ID1715]|uniref:isoaspartyl peptidase/L-asparaginase family protein n=1 Tax=Sphingomonas sp. ID1715 TaxID=1656898 RepID=UPI001489843B|nr:isoaspartyl peptidase/L-asparaginase [Sphingomonas sp. ID1715]
MKTVADWTLVVHGGAGIIEQGNLNPEEERSIREALSRALEAGAAILREGGAALDAAEAAVRVLEDDPNFNAGRGSVFTYDGAIEMDAAVMDGRTRDAGAVTGVTRTRNPVTLARRVMEDSPHVLLSRDGADTFSREQGLEQADADWFAIAERRRQLDELKAQGDAYFDARMKYGTVGAVARDRFGHLAAATSTGGITGKRWGRIGDSPLIGAGTYADDRAGAVSATGSGEYFIRAVVAHEICARARIADEGVLSASRAVMKDVGALGGTGGVIVVGPDGTGGWAFNSAGMYRGKVSSESDPVVAIYGDE